MTQVSEQQRRKLKSEESQSRHALNLLEEYKEQVSYKKEEGMHATPQKGYR